MQRATLLIAVITGLTSLTLAYANPSVEYDPEFRWLKEDLTNPAVVRFVNTENQRVKRYFDKSDADDSIEPILDILNSDKRLIAPDIQGNNVFMFRKGWYQGKKYDRGAYFRMSLPDYTAGSETWELLLDLEEIEGPHWVWKGAVCASSDYFPEDTEPWSRCLIKLARKGERYKRIIREFDVLAKAFVVENPFTFTEEGPMRAYWIDKNRIYLGTDFGEDPIDNFTTLTKANYPRLAKIVRRGEGLERASTACRGDYDHSSATGFVYFGPKVRRAICIHSLTARRAKKYFIPTDPIRGDHERGYFMRLPKSARMLGLFHPHKHEEGKTYEREKDQKHDRAVILFQDDWSCGVKPTSVEFRAGQIALLPLKKNVCTSTEVVFDPGKFGGQVNQPILTGSDSLIVPTLDKGRGKVWEIWKDRKKGWTRQEIPLPQNGSLDMVARDSGSGAILRYASFNVPPTFFFIQERGRSERDSPIRLQSQDPLVNIPRLVVSFIETESSYGDPVAYFLVHRSGVPLDGRNPTLLTAYGGIASYTKPRYDPILIREWLQHGYIAAFAIVPGGPERGPSYQALGMGTNRPRSFAAFLRAARHLVETGYTSPPYLGALGSSNGGLLVMASYIQKPSLFGAIVSQNPLLVMMEYLEDPKGPSWRDSYGDPNEKYDREVLRSYSPFRNIYRVAGRKVNYPFDPVPNIGVVFLVGSSRDQVTPPHHPRRMAARMNELGLPYFYLETDAGHSGYTNNIEAAELTARVYAFLRKELGPFGKHTITVQDRPLRGSLKSGSNRH